VGDILLIWVKREAEYFCERDWTGQIRLMRQEKFASEGSDTKPRERMTDEDGSHRDQPRFDMVQLGGNRERTHFELKRLATDDASL
jgi:hypothetical protein